MGLDSQQKKEDIIQRMVGQHDVKIFTENIEEEALKQIG